MKKLLALIYLLTLLISCKEEVRQPPLTKEEINGARLWERMTGETDYSTYSFWPGHEGIHPGQAPHGVNHRIYINKDLLEALPIESKVAPYGTIIVKENMDRERNTGKITVMAKVEGYDPEGNDWFWAAYSTEGEVLAEGKPEGCVSCHSGMKSNDYIIVRQLNIK